MWVYRYEIYAPGGIWVTQILGDPHQYPLQDEVTFIGAIVPQYIRSAQSYIITQPFGSRYQIVEREDDRLYMNRYFNPQSHPERELRIRRPISKYKTPDGQYKDLTKVEVDPFDDESRANRQVSRDAYDWYANRVEDIDSYINAAFRARSTNEAYLFMKNDYVLVNYAPGSTNDRIINGPLLICDGYHSLVGTAFGEHGIDCAFDTDGTEAFIFSGKLCACINYAPGSTNDRILQGPMTIAAMFPFFKGTAFENSIDAAFRATARNEAYLFKGDQYALINYNSKTQIAIRRINEGFHSFIGTIFESGIEAAFASHRTNEAYIFKGDQYALINFAPGSTNDYIIGGVKKIVEHWPSLKSILPCKNRGLDQHDHPDDQA
ncbi:albumin-2-like isoform X2 [Prosopis cineraria]|uniref:albumin-2-like isoform X2 n=1 Tax=Prosopis cineraria TaxID=364024 RepID=UPI00241034E9|nr:albumin-2-like isoform X2 [Prosopis cineraria]